MYDIFFLSALSSAEEHRPSKPQVAGSNPAGRAFVLLIVAVLFFFVIRKVMKRILFLIIFVVANVGGVSKELKRLEGDLSSARRATSTIVNIRREKQSNQAKGVFDSRLDERLQKLLMIWMLVYQMKLKLCVRLKMLAS